MAENVKNSGGDNLSSFALPESPAGDASPAEDLKRAVAWLNQPPCENPEHLRGAALWELVSNARNRSLGELLGQIRKDEREKCAEIAEDSIGERIGGDHDNGMADVARRRIADRIRARGAS